MSDKLKELLKKLLGDELYKTVADKLEGEKAFKVDVIQEGEKSLFIPMTRFKEVNEKQKAAQKDIDAANEKSANEITDLTGKLKKLAESGGDVEQIKKQVTDLQTEVKKAGDDAAEGIKQAKVKSHVRETLLGENANAEYLDFLEGKINFKKIATSDDGNTHTGVKEQIPEIKKNLAAMFGATSKKKITGTGHQGGDGDGDGLPEGIFTEDEIKAMDHKAVQTNMEKVDKSLEYHAAQKT